MSLGILTNVAATYAQNNLNQTQGSLQKVLQQLSSGSRINSGADDAAGLAVADGLAANEAALDYYLLPSLEVRLRHARRVLAYRMQPAQPTWQR